MAQLIFPSNPVNDQEYVGDNGLTYVYKTTPGVWTSPASGGSPLTPANPGPSDFSASPAFAGGTGTLANPYIITPARCYPGGRATSAQTITVSNQPIGEYLIFSDVNASTNGIRFSQDAPLIDVQGGASFVLGFNDSPTTTAGGTFTGLIKCGTTYFRWVVTVDTTSYDNLPVTGPGGGFYSVSPTNTGGSFTKTYAWDTTSNWMSYAGGMYYTNSNQFGSHTLALNSSGSLFAIVNNGNSWQSFGSFGAGPWKRGVTAGNYTTYSSGGNLTYEGGTLIVLQKADLSLSVWGQQMYTSSLQLTSINSGPPATVKTFRNLNLGNYNGVVAVGTNGSVYAQAIVQDGNTTTYYKVIQPGLGLIPQATSTAWGTYMTSPLTNGETIVDAQALGSHLIVLTNANKLYTTQGATSMQSPVLICDNAVGFSVVGGSGLDLGVLKRDGSIWCRTVGTGSFGTNIPFRKLVTDQSFLTPPYPMGGSWYALNSGGQAYGAQGSTEAIRFTTQPAAFYNNRQVIFPVIFEGLA